MWLYNKLNADTSEYQTIRKCIPQLMTAFKHNLTELSGHLLSRGLITEDQSCELRNPMHSESSRASRLVDFVLSKVELNSDCYHTFIECLSQDEENNRQILEILNGGKCDYPCISLYYNVRDICSIVWELIIEIWMIYHNFWILCI